MTDLQSFINEYTDTYVEIAGSPNAINQCVDLANAWILEGWGLPIIEWTNAQDFPKKKEPHFEFIENKLDIFPNPGDLVIFKSPDSVGHISVYVKYIHKNLFTSFDQNYPLGSPCKLVNHNYQNVLGWMRPKGDSMPDEGTKATKDMVLGFHVEGLSDTDTVGKLDEEYQKERGRTKSCRADREKLKEMVESLEKDVKELNTKLADTERVCQNQIIQINKARSTFLEEISPNKKEPIEDFDGAIELINTYKFGSHLKLGEIIGLLINILRGNK